MALKPGGLGERKSLMNLFRSLHRHRVQYFQNVNVRVAWIKERNSLVTGFLYFVDMLYIYMYKNFNSIFLL